MKIPKTLVPSPDGFRNSLQDTEASSCSEADPTAACECGGCQDAPGESASSVPKLEAPTTYRVDARAMYGGDIPSVHMALCAKSPFLLVKITIYLGSNYHLCWFKSPSILKKQGPLVKKIKPQSVGQNHCLLI